MNISIMYCLRNFSILFIYLFATFRAIACFPGNPEGYVSIVGISEYEKITFVRLQRQTYLWDDFFNPIFDLTIRGNHQKFESQFLLQSPALLNFNIIGRSIKIYVTPGDKISFLIRKSSSSRPEVVFNGQRSSNYNYGELYENRNFILNRKLIYTAQQSPDSFKLLIDDWYKNEIQLLRNFKLEHDDFSKSYYEYMLQDIGFRYASLLYSPFRKDKSLYKHVPDSYFLQSDRIFTTAKISQFSENAMDALASKYIFGYNNNNNIEENYFNVYKNIIKRFNGPTREYLLCNFFGILSKTQNENCLIFLSAHFDDANRYISDTNYIKYLERCNRNISKVGRAIPDSIALNTILVSYNGDTISMKQLLNLYTNKPLYIDLWASWCSACRIDIKNSAAAKAYFKKEDIQNIYLSLDKGSQAPDWKKASEMDGIIENQFIIVNEFSSKFIKYLGVKYLPRYIVLSKEHTVASYDAPRPNNAQFAELKKVFEAEAISGR
ncbi:TlpA family protein disulfide reductase [Chitinophaga eiseniae]|uniref:Redoxin domain-containing protein n=1 Tax=Chitinophaga eiseniae TaxID=634771 RepID=A0A847SUD0_9BACT|nr:redoxin domain-containing protein [Chitinophaga eiseniae]NLR81446.1 redoxin domain-containing protein [Chitinophaga eiseniae]